MKKSTGPKYGSVPRLSWKKLGQMETFKLPPLNKVLVEPVELVLPGNC